MLNRVLSLSVALLLIQSYGFADEKTKQVSKDDKSDSIYASLLKCFQAEVSKKGTVKSSPYFQLRKSRNAEGTQVDGSPAISCSGETAKLLYNRLRKHGLKTQKFEDHRYIGFFVNFGKKGIEGNSACYRYADADTDIDVFQYWCFLTISLDECFTDGMKAAGNVPTVKLVD